MIRKIKEAIKKKNFRKVLADYFLLTIGSIILAINFDIFLAPLNIAPGGGLVVLIGYLNAWLAASSFENIVVVAGRQEVATILRRIFPELRLTVVMPEQN